MDCVGNLSSPCSLHEKLKGEFIFLGTNVPNSCGIKRKDFA